VDGVRFDIRALFEYLITSFGLSEGDCHINIEFSVTVDMAQNSTRTQDMPQSDLRYVTKMPKILLHKNTYTQIERDLRMTIR
jgi:hypothetical protein